jgi:hypothetical protein
MGKISRKNFLKNIFFSGTILLGGSALLSACGGQKKEPGSSAAKVNDPCTDLSGLSQADLQTRTQFNYTGQTPDEDKFCSNCLHWRAPKSGNNPCGTCELVKGPINPNGYCTQWMQKPKTTG